MQLKKAFSCISNGIVQKGWTSLLSLFLYVSPIFSELCPWFGSNNMVWPQITFGWPKDKCVHFHQKFRLGSQNMISLHINWSQIRLFLFLYLFSIIWPIFTEFSEMKQKITFHTFHGDESLWICLLSYMACHTILS